MMRVAKLKTMFMSCSMKSTEMSSGKRGDDAEQHGALVLRNAGGGLVEQQHLRPRRERQRDLEQPLLAVGQGARRARRDLGEAQLSRIAKASSIALLCEARLRQNCPATRSRSQIASVTASIGVRSGNSVLIWKVRVRPCRTRAAAGVCVTSLPSSTIRPESGLQLPGDQVDQRGLAGAVGTDQRVAGAARQRDRDVARHPQRAEALFAAPRSAGRSRRLRISPACPRGATSRRECRSA